MGAIDPLNIESEIEAEKRGYKSEKEKRIEEIKEGILKAKRESLLPLGCFIATAVYNDVNAPQLQTLRDFRDEILMQNYLGKILVKFYYSGIGEKTANFIKNNLPSTIPVIKKGLDILVERYSIRK